MLEEQNGQDKEQDVQEEVTTSETPAEDEQSDELPEDAKERTKREFEKLKAHNKELADEVERLKKPSQSALEGLHPQTVQAEYPNLTQQQVDDTIKSLVDEDGYLDEALLKNTLNKANQSVAQAQAEAQRARQEARQALIQVNKFGQDREVRIAHKRFPQVDPENAKYDPEFFRLVRNELLASMYEGKKMEFVDACRSVKKVYSPKKDETETKAKAVEEYKESVASKSALNPTGSSRPESRHQDDLIEGTRRGDADAIAARLAKLS
jgi:energy-converting hydrogenase A subunit M